MIKLSRQHKSDKIRVLKAYNAMQMKFAKRYRKSARRKMIAREITKLERGLRKGK